MSWTSLSLQGEGTKPRYLSASPLHRISSLSSEIRGYSLLISNELLFLCSLSSYKAARNIKSGSLDLYRATSSYSIIATLSILMRAVYFYVGSSARDAPCLSKKNPTLQCWLLTLMRTHVPAMCWPWSYRQLSCFFNSALNLEIWSALGLGRSLGLSSIQGQSYFFLLGKTSFFCKLSQYSCKLNL